MKNSQIILTFIASSLVSVGTITGTVQELVHFRDVASEIAVFIISGGMSVLCAGILIAEGTQNVHNFFKK